MSRTRSISGSWRSSKAVGLAVAAMCAAAPVRLRAQVLDTIVVENHNVFDDADEVPVIARLANSLHIRTRASVIRRSLLVNKGDRYDSARVAESERALRALNVFRFVAMDTVRLRGDGRLALRVVTADGWSTRPQANFSSAGGDQSWEVGLVEQNFLGTASALAASYRHTPDRSGVELQYLNPHLLARRMFGFARYADLSDGRRGGWFLGVPFFQTAARHALLTDGEAAQERALQFRDGALVADSQRRALRIGVSAGIAPVATSRDYVRVWLSGQWRREDFAPDTTSPFPRSTFGAVGAGVDIGHVRFRVMEHFNSYARREDVNLSQSLGLGLWVAPRAWGYGPRQAGVGPLVRGQVSSVWRRGFAVLRGDGHGVFGSAGLDSGRVRGQLTVATQSLTRQSVILHVEGAVAKHPKPGTEYDLWLEQRGPRLFGAHAFTGTRMVWATLEDRILVQEEVSGLVGVGLAAFLDWGGAWYADERARLGANVGVALRLGPTRAVGGDATELAVGYRFGEALRAGSRHWAVTLRKGIAF